ncbi:MAG: GNAT family N-acetyltransferase [Bacillota bacterium]|nr:GNAT family N-acetyltransferase [Bacillota bacterium]
MLIVRQARNLLKKHRVDQWQGEYPAEENFRIDIAKGICYVIEYGGRMAAFFTMADTPEEDYVNLTDGKWHGSGPYCTMHRAAVAAEFRGTGLSERIYEFAEEIARGKGIHEMRVDTHRKNKAMLALLKRKGYVYRGNVKVSSEPGHDPARQAFEKIGL